MVFFGRLAEIVSEYLKKGSQVYVEGRLQTRKWEDKTGNDRYTTEIVANEMQMLGGRGGGGGMAPNEQAPASMSDSKPDSGPAAADNDFVDDDIPF